jgi:phenol 2-monooxygenase
MSLAISVRHGTHTIDSMKHFGVEVERSTVPTSIQLTDDEVTVADPASSVVKVSLRSAPLILLAVT